MATVALGLAAGGPTLDATRLGIAMVALQASIGALNDIRDVEADRVAKPAKPIPAGRASAMDGRLIVAGGLVVGLALSTPSGPATVAVAIAGAACGYGYDLGLKTTALSWLPLAIALPLVPTFAWLGVGAALPPAFVILLPLAVAAGAGLALANALADVEGDRVTGLATIVNRLGAPAAWRAHLVIQGAVVAVALGTLAALGGRAPWPVLAVAAGSLMLAGAWLVGSGGAGLRQRAWELEAVGVAALGAAWVAALAGVAA